MKIKKNDNIIVIAGKDRNKKGKVVSVLPDAEKVIVGGINLFKRHQKPRRGGEKGKTITVEAPLRISNIALVCTKCGKATRVGYKTTESKEKIRICKKCNQEI